MKAHYFKLLAKNSRARGNSGFTLVEILIVVIIVVILAVIALLLINPTMQRKKLYDSQRKRDLGRLRGLYDDYFLYNLRYPTAQEVCYDDPIEVSAGVCQCNICGLEKDVGTFSPLLHVLYCDPEHPIQQYVYEYDCGGSEPLWYKIYAKLSLNSYLGPDGQYTCNFGVSNRDDSFLLPYPFTCEEEPSGGGGPTSTPGPTSPPPAPTSTSAPLPTPKYCILSSICNICGTYAQCLQPDACDQPLTLYSNSSCTQICSLP